MIVDFHTHAFPEAIASRTIAKLASKANTKPYADGTAEGLSAAARAAGVDLSIVLPVATSARQVPSINAYAAQVNERTAETGLLSFGGMHPDFDDWHGELGRLAVQGFKGIKLHPVYQGVDLDDVRFLRILERAGELGLVVVTHAGWDIGFPGVSHCTPEMTRRALRQVGPVKLVLAHMGGWRQWDQVLELLVDTSALLDTSFSTGTREPYETGPVPPEELNMMNTEQFMGMVEAFGAERVLFGTDSPWSDQRESLDWLRALPLPEADLAAILGGNAQGLLGMG